MTSRLIGLIDLIGGKLTKNQLFEDLGRLHSRSQLLCTLMCTHKGVMAAIKVGVREFRERIARFLEVDSALSRDPSR